MSKPVLRTYKDSGDLKRMQQLTQSIWSRESNYHIGDLAWQRYRHGGREEEWMTAIWEVDNQTVAWGWIKLPGSLMFQVDPNFPNVSKEVIEWFDKVTETNEQQVTVLETESHLITALEDFSFYQIDELPEVLLKISLNRPFQVHLPDKFITRHLKGEEDWIGYT